MQKEKDREREREGERSAIIQTLWHTHTRKKTSHCQETNQLIAPSSDMANYKEFKTTVINNLKTLLEVITHNDTWVISVKRWKL